VLAVCAGACHDPVIDALHVGGMMALHSSALVTDEAWDRAVGELIEAGRILGSRGWVPATSGNLSRRVDDGTIAITASGIDKARLHERHLMRIRIDAPPPRNASAETALHLASYRRDGALRAILHVHSLNATLISRRFAAEGAVRIEGFELAKAFAGVTTHETPITVPVFQNSQDVAALAETVEARLARPCAGDRLAPGYLLAGHGLYAWGRDMAETLRHLEAFDFLFACLLAEGGPS